MAFLPQVATGNWHLVQQNLPRLRSYEKRHRTCGSDSLPCSVSVKNRVMGRKLGNKLVAQSVLVDYHVTHIHAQATVCTCAVGMPDRLDLAGSAEQFEHD